MEKPNNCVLVIFGASGDLTKRKLVPALYDLYLQGLCPDGFAVLGVSRTELNDQTFRQQMIEAVNQFAEKKPIDKALLELFSKKLYYEAIDTNNAEDYAKVTERLKFIDREQKTSGNYIFYLSTPPNMYEVITNHLSTQNLQSQAQGKRRIIIEKPFGYDLPSALNLNQKLHQVFKEDQIYRIDHYLGKETVQNILVFRFANGIFEPLWNRNYVHHVEVTSAENIGIENRGRYYDASGALRDMIQNHLLQVVGIIAMEPPSTFDSRMVRNETMKVFQSLRPIKPEEVHQFTVRGQYTEAHIRGKVVGGYRQEKDIPADSRTETYAALKFYIDNWRWGGVPFYVRAGKRLPTRVTEVVIHFKPTPHKLFGQYHEFHSGYNQLVIRIQPDEGILLKFGMKMPGAGFQVKDVNMDFLYSDLSNTYVPTAYERLLLDCMLGDSTLYSRGDAVEACWEFVMPILEGWKNNPNSKVFGYPAGTWGPKEADQMMLEEGVTWRQPCKNLSNDGVYCEL